MTVTIDEVQSRIQMLIDDGLMPNLAILHERLDSLINDSVRTSLAEDTSLLKLGRFPEICAAINTMLQTRFASSLEETRKQTQAIVNALVDPKPFIKLAIISDSAAGAPLRVKITLDHEALAVTLLSYYSATTTNLIRSLLTSPEPLLVIETAPPAHWLETCAKQRTALIQRLEDLVHARSVIIRVWDVRQAKVDIALCEAGETA